MITIFKNFGDITNPFHTPIENVLRRIKEGASQQTVDQIRETVLSGGDPRDLKASLPLVLFSVSKTKAVTITKKDKTYETHRSDDSVVEHSGYFALDFDKCDVEQKLEQLKKDPYIYACWLGPSGNGVKALVRCPASVEHHHEYYTAFLDRYPELDTTSRNISRGTYESYDPNIFFNRGSIVWDKRMNEEDRKKNLEKEKNKRGRRIMSIAADMVRSSYDGTKHSDLLKAANLLGGYVATGRVDEGEALKLLETEIRLKGPADLDGALQTIRDGIAHGKARPLHETKKIEKAVEYLKREDGTYDFLASNEEMTEYELAVINGTLKMGEPTGMNALNEYWMFKEHHLVWFAGIDNTGKSFLVWYLAVLASMLHNKKVLIYSSENRDGMLRKKLKEFYMGKQLRVMDDEELTMAHEWVQEHFRIMTSKQMHTVDEMLMKAEIVYDEGFEFDIFIAEPYNSFDVPRDLDMHRHNLYALNRMRVFKENYATLWVCDHVNSTAARKKDKDGYVEAPWKSDVEYGQLKANKCDDFVMIHRLINHPQRKYETEVHVHKIKDRETGGNPTPKDEPVILQLGVDFCSYDCYGQNPTKDYWKTLNKNK